jgi:hypothetical protein
MDELASALGRDGIDGALGTCAGAFRLLSGDQGVAFE